mmetsp:Transcript_14458/g.16409  ORF Transcript_14458/g.16409 Transcript_14458/m.16409 type:complete len:83 (-) Transcript_14458:136-384(-)
MRKRQTPSKARSRKTKGIAKPPGGENSCQFLSKKKDVRVDTMVSRRAKAIIKKVREMVIIVGSNLSSVTIWVSITSAVLRNS